MEFIIYISIPIIAVIIAGLRAEKGKKSVLLLTIVMGCYEIFNTIALLNALGKGDENTIYTGFKLIVVTLIVYFAELYITEKEAKKHKNSNDDTKNE